MEFLGEQMRGIRGVVVIEGMYVYGNSILVV